MRVRLGAIGAALMLCLLRVAPASAAHFVIVDKQVGTGPPAASQASSADPCTFEFFQDANGDTDGRSAFTLTRSNTRASFVDASCSLTAFLFEFAVVTYSLQPDPGEVLGAPLALCFQGEHDISAQSTAGFTAASVTYGGVPIADPAQILRNGSPVFSSGPNTVTNGSDADHAGGGFTANIGDQIALEVQTNTDLFGNGVASETTHTFNRLYVSIGPCAGAPAASHGGLAVLAVGLAALAVLRLRRRSQA